MKSPDDPVDHARTTRKHAGETMKDTKNLPALVLLGFGLVCFVGALAAFGAGHPGVGGVLVVVAAVLLIIAGAWLFIEHKRVRRIEDRWYTDHPNVPRQHPTS